ncbi:hypothetical protein MXD99_15250, partial [Legionella pneumophila]|nr:hypothetical protein [Legionella pneumophila]
GFTLLALQAFEVFTDTGETSPLLNVVKLSGVALTLTESALILINSYLYGDGSVKTRGATLFIMQIEFMDRISFCSDSTIPPLSN